MAERDKRGYWSLPERREEQSYYVYGTPIGLAQYAHPAMLSFLLKLDFHWGQVSDFPIGIGNISLANGSPWKEHGHHDDGLKVDVRPFRLDRKPLPVSCHSADYDRDETRKLVAAMWSIGTVKKILFNDRTLPRVTPWPRHDNHLHVEVAP